MSSGEVDLGGRGLLYCVRQRAPLAFEPYWGRVCLRPSEIYRGHVQVLPLHLSATPRFLMLPLTLSAFYLTTLIPSITHSVGISYISPASIDAFVLAIPIF